MARTHALIAASTLGLGLLLSPAAGASTVIRCESVNEQWRSCPADTRGGVRLVLQLSPHGCWEGDTWGYDRNRIWVTRGCRAEFRIGDPGGPSGDAAAAVAGAVVLGLIVAAIASHDDDHDRYRYRDRYESYYDGYYDGRYDPRYDDRYPGNWGAPSYRFTCQSRDDRFTVCPSGAIRGRGHVEVVRQLSRTPCRYGYSWGVDRNRVWVNHGCRAEFGVFR